MEPIYGTTLDGTYDIFRWWLNGEDERDIKFLITCISINKPETPNNNPINARHTIEKWMEDNFTN